MSCLRVRWAGRFSTTCFVVSQVVPSFTCDTEPIATQKFFYVFFAVSLTNSVLCSPGQALCSPTQCYAVTISEHPPKIKRGNRKSMKIHHFKVIRTHLKSLNIIKNHSPMGFPLKILHFFHGLAALPSDLQSSRDHILQFCCHMRPGPTPAIGVGIRQKKHSKNINRHPH